MLIKVCGITQNEDLVSVSQLPVDFAGFIFVPSSPRFAAGKIDPELLKLFSRTIPSMKKTGIFIDEEITEVQRYISHYSLDAVQLHGDESPEYCNELYENTTVIKTFSVNEPDSFEKTIFYEGKCNYFLFDTAGPLPGGNGFPFDWNLLDYYTGSTPFFLSGGIGPQDILKIYEIQHPMFAGIDINSRFEIYSGKKDIVKLQRFVQSFKRKNYGIPGF